MSTINKNTHKKNNKNKDMIIKAFKEFPLKECTLGM